MWANGGVSFPLMVVWERNENSLEGLVVSSLAMTDPLAKLMIAKGIIKEAEFNAQLGAERANYLVVLKRLN